MTEKKDIPFSIRPPVVTDAWADEGVRPFLDFITALQEHGGVAAAKKEARRLGPYFGAMSEYLARAIETADRPAEAKAELQAIAKKSSLKNIFNAMSAIRKNVLLSEVAVLPYAICDVPGPAKRLFTEQRFEACYRLNARKFDFGFLQVFQTTPGNAAISAAVLPILFVDDGMIGELPEKISRPLLESVQKAFTFINHDMLHHFTMPWINEQIVHNWSTLGRKDSAVNDWVKSEVKETYEEWAHIAHEKLVQQPAYAGKMEELRKNIDSFFDVLETVPLKHGASRSRNGEIVEYYGMLMAHTVSRILPLNHPLLTHVLERLEKADPLPGKVAENWTAHLPRNPLFSDEQNILIHAEKPHIEQAVEAYKNAGFDFMGEKGSGFDYRKIRLLQLISITDGYFHSDINAHIPSDTYGPVASVRKDIDAITIDMIKAAASDVKIKVNPAVRKTDVPQN